ncbi:MAG: hypothetical protein ACR2MS_01560 [Weeksellaceae bacterium]
MGIFKNLFQKKRTFMIDDADFGLIKGNKLNKDVILWEIKHNFFNKVINIYIEGNEEGIFKTQKEILVSALNHESEIRQDTENALQAELKNADLHLNSIEDYFDDPTISVNCEGFELSFQEKNEPYYIFNVQFKDNKLAGVSIDS